MKNRNLANTKISKSKSTSFEKSDLDNSKNEKIETLNSEIFQAPKNAPAILVEVDLNKIFIAKRIESNNSGKLGGREAQIHKLTNDQRYLEKRILDIYQAVIKIISEFKIPALYLENALEEK